MISTPARPTEARSAHATFAAERESPHHARAFVADHIVEWHGVDHDGVAQLLVSELVTNAVLHAGTPAEVDLRYLDDTFRVAVSDEVAGGIDVEEASQPLAVGAPSGRGLHIVDGLADRWGVTMGDGTKTVWFEVAMGTDDTRGDR